MLKYGADFRHVTAPLRQHANYGKSGLTAPVLDGDCYKCAVARPPTIIL